VWECGAIFTDPRSRTLFYGRANFNSRAIFHGPVLFLRDSGVEMHLEPNLRPERLVIEQPHMAQPASAPVTETKLTRHINLASHHGKVIFAGTGARIDFFDAVNFYGSVIFLESVSFTEVMFKADVCFRGATPLCLYESSESAEQN
jgi:hypothetical protein